MLISRKTYCYKPRCRGNFVRKKAHKDDWLFHDKCDTCGAKKMTGIHTGFIVYMPVGVQLRDE